MREILFQYLQAQLKMTYSSNCKHKICLYVSSVTAVGEKTVGTLFVPVCNYNIQLQIVQNHKTVKDFTSGNPFYPTSVILFSHVLVTRVPLHCAPLSVFVSQLYSSCKVMQLQLASIWQRYFFSLSESSAGKLYS